ncbi:MAG: hypothetical protein ACI8TE_001097 [Francisella sp.]|jgi:hypothetical protein
MKLESHLAKDLDQNRKNGTTSKTMNSPSYFSVANTCESNIISSHCITVITPVRFRTFILRYS